MLEPVDLMKLQPIDATNGIVLGLFMGAGVSTYVSIVVNRLADFRQIRLAAISEISQLPRALAETGSYAHAAFVLKTMLKEQRIAFGIDRQIPAQRIVARVAECVRLHCETKLRDEVASRGAKSVEAYRAGEWTEVVLAVCDGLEPFLRVQAGYVRAASPSYPHILMLLPRNGRVRASPGAVSRGVYGRS